MYKAIERGRREAILQEVKDGVKVAEVAAKHGLSDRTIYGWMKDQADNTGTSALDVARLRRENVELKELIGLFALEKKRAEKNPKGA